MKILLVALIASPVFAEDPKPKPDPLKGTWVVESARTSGNVNVRVVGRLYHFDGKRASFTTRQGIARDMGTYKFDLTKKLKTVDFSAGFKGVFEVKNGKLLLCLGLNRPKKLESVAGVREISIVASKEKPGKKPKGT